MAASITIAEGLTLRVGQHLRMGAGPRDISRIVAIEGESMSLEQIPVQEQKDLEHLNALFGRRWREAVPTIRELVAPRA